MANSEFDVELFERRLLSLKDSQESIQGLSSWCLERRQHHKKIVATWLQVLKKVKVEHRLTLFYLANDVIQYSKRKNFEFVESWGTTLQRATTMVRDEKVKHRILRIFKIWDQRQVYDEEFLTDLSGLLSAAPKKKTEQQTTMQSDEFQAALLISTMRSCATLEQATDARLRDLRECNIDIENAEELCANLKDRRRVEDAEKEVETAVRNVENYVRALEAEIRERTQVIELLEQADQFYETQRGEVKIVTNAYRNFGSRVKNLKKKLDELLPTLTSPIPSPDINAPSPSPDSDIELPGDEKIVNKPAIIDVAPPSLYGTYTQDYDPAPLPVSATTQSTDSSDFTNNFYSFIGGNMDFGSMKNLFNERSTTPTGINQQYNDSLEAKPIEVIGSRTSKTDNDDFSISSFLKTVLPGSDRTPIASSIPGLGLDSSEAPMDTDYRHSPRSGLPGTPLGSRNMNQGTGLNNCQISHSTPLPVRNLSGESHTPSPYSSQNSQSNITMPFDGTGASSAVNPLPPPPLPPPIFLDDENCYNKLPPKFPTWTPPNEAIKESSKWEEKANYAIGKNSMNPSWPSHGEDDKQSWMENERWDAKSESNWPTHRGKRDMLSETPESPPMYEKSSFNEPISYDDSQQQEPLLSSAADVDHRIIPVPMSTENQLPYRLMKGADVDHRNLISLTGSPANHNNINDASLNNLSNNSNLWSAGDQDYRQHVQPGDIVESVDMEMSDDEMDSKQKGRVLVDVRSQDRDMRVPIPTQHADMDMRMIPLPSSQMPSIRNPIMPDSHIMHPGGPPPSSSQFHPPNFHQGQSDFHHNAPDFHVNPNFHQNQTASNFMMNQSPDFHSPQDFHQMHPSQQEFRQDFEFRDNQHNPRVGSEFLGDTQMRSRYNTQDHSHRDSSNFHRSDRNGRGGRGFPRNRRDRYDDHGHQQRNAANNRKHRRSSPEMHINSRSHLSKPSETSTVTDDEGMSSKTLKSSHEESVNLQNRTSEEQNCVFLNEVSDIANEADQCQDVNQPVCRPGKQQEHGDRVSADSKDTRQSVYNVTSSYAESDEHTASQGEQDRLDNRECEMDPEESSRPLSEHLEDMMKSSDSLDHSVTGMNVNGSFDDIDQADCSPTKKSKGQSEIESSGYDANGPPDSHSSAGFDMDGQSPGSNFRQRTSVSGTFSPWRGAHPRGRSSFRGGPRMPWIDRPPRGPPSGNFMPRNLKRGGQFRGGGFRGRGRGGNW